MDDKPTYDELEQKAEELEDEVAKLKKLKKHWLVLSSAIDGSSEGMAIIDLDGNLHYLNSAFAEVHGYSVNDLLGKHFSIFHTQQQMPSVKAANRQVKKELLSEKFGTPGAMALSFLQLCIIHLSEMKKISLYTFLVRFAISANKKSWRKI
jgi:transcriptional regulator with PAS, ATPase and Fis domain